MEHRPSTRTRHLTLLCAVPFASFQVRCLLYKFAILVRRQVWGVPGYSSLLFPLWVPFQCPLDYMFIRSPQRVANPCPSSSSLFLLYRSLPCLSPKLLAAEFSRPQNTQDFPQALIATDLLQSLSQSASKFQNHTIAPPSNITQTLSLVLLLWVAILVSTSQIPVLPFQLVPECPCQCLPSCLQCCWYQRRTATRCYVLHNNPQRSYLIHYSFSQLWSPPVPLSIFYPARSWCAPGSLCKTPYSPCSATWCHASFYLSWAAWLADPSLHILLQRNRRTSSDVSLPALIASSKVLKLQNCV